MEYPEVPSDHSPLPPEPGFTQTLFNFLARGKKIWIALGVVIGLIALYQTLQYSFFIDILNSPFYKGKIDLTEPRTSSPETYSEFMPGKSPNLRVAVAPLMSPERTYPLYLPIVKYLAARVGKKPQLIERQTYSEVNELVRENACDLAFVGDYPFVLGERNFGMRALVVPQVQGQITYQSYVLVPHHSGAKSLLDLKGKKFAFADILSNTGWLFPAVWLKKNGANAESFFSSYFITGSHDLSIQAVISGLADGTAVNSQIYDLMVDQNPQILKETRLIQKSPLYGIPPVVTSKNIDPVLRASLLKALLGMHQDPEGKKALAGLRIEKFRVADPALYDSVRANVKFFEGSR